jgi:hypothetical protein
LIENLYSFTYLSFFNILIAVFGNLCTLICFYADNCPQIYLFVDEYTRKFIRFRSCVFIYHAMV